MPQLNGGGGDDLGANDELISFKDEGEQEEKISENSSAERDLADVKSSLVNESETNQNSSSDSEVRGTPRGRAGGGRGPQRGRGRRVPLPPAPNFPPRHQLVTMPSVLFCFLLFCPFPPPLPPHLLSSTFTPHLSPPTPHTQHHYQNTPSPLSPRRPRPSPRRSGGPRLAPKLSEINPEKVWRKVSTARPGPQPLRPLPIAGHFAKKNFFLSSPSLLALPSVAPFLPPLLSCLPRHVSCEEARWRVV